MTEELTIKEIKKLAKRLGHKVFILREDIKTYDFPIPKTEVSKLNPTTGNTSYFKICYSPNPKE